MLLIALKYCNCCRDLHYNRPQLVSFHVDSLLAEASRATSRGHPRSLSGLGRGPPQVPGAPLPLKREGVAAPGDPGSLLLATPPTHCALQAALKAKWP